MNAEIKQAYNTYEQTNKKYIGLINKEKDPKEKSKLARSWYNKLGSFNVPFCDGPAWLWDELMEYQQTAKNLIK